MAKPKPILKTVTVKLYPTQKQIKTLEGWLRVCCWIYNRALEQRKKAYERRGESTTLYAQQRLLTKWRRRISRLRALPAFAGRSPLAHLDRAFQAFFRRVSTGEKPGYPRWRSEQRYNSFEINDPGRYVRGNVVRLPKLGKIRFRGGAQEIAPTQKLLRIIRRPSGWYAQVVFECGAVPEKQLPETIPDHQAAGVDLGLTHWLAINNGVETTYVDNPRLLEQTAVALRKAHKAVSRKVRGSHNRRKAVNALARLYEKLTARRLDFCHRESRKLVNQFDVISFENFKITNMVRGNFAKSILDACWGLLRRQLAYKAENAGKHAVPVEYRRTSQECPNCGHVRRKELHERVHHCERCGFRCERDAASAMVVRARGLRVVRSSPVEGGSAAARRLVLRPVRPPGEAGSLSCVS